tara:strand:+ start:802 stop:1041 length:240 start_codon:yes stop_codon:yes gene_type:complete
MFAIAYLTCVHIPSIYSGNNIKGVKTMTDKKNLIGFSEAAHATISEAAERVGLSFSAFTRSAALKEANRAIDAQAKGPS